MCSHTAWQNVTSVFVLRWLSCVCSLPKVETRLTRSPMSSWIWHVCQYTAKVTELVDSFRWCTVTLTTDGTVGGHLIVIPSSDLGW